MKQRLAGFGILLFACLNGLMAQTRAAPAVPANSVVNNASFAAGTNPLAPGTIAAIFGTGLDDGSSNASSSFGSNGKLLTTLGGASVTFNGVAAPLFSAFPGQLNVQIPLELAGMTSATVVVTVAGKSSPPQTVPIAAFSPGIFTIPSGGTGQGAIQLSNTATFAAPSGSIPGAAAGPVSPGQSITIFCVGLGAVTNPPATGAPASGASLSNTVMSPQVTIGGIPASVSFSGLAPGFVGLYQVNAQVPGVLSGNAVPVVLTIGGAQSNSVTIAVSALQPITFYVAPNGNDTWSGKLPAPNSANTDGPFATFDHARAAVQPVNKAGLSQVVVQFRAGTYYLPATEQFTAADSGTASTEIVYENYPGESPVISGGVPVQNWTNVSGNTWKTTLPASTQYFENLFYNGVRRLRPRLGVSPGNSLGTYYRIANTVYLTAPGPPAAAPQANCSIYVAGSGWECFDRFQYNSTDPIVNTWKNLALPAGNPCGQTAGNPALSGDIELLDFEKYQAAKLRISCVDAVNHIVYLTGPTDINSSSYTALGFLPQNRYLVENVQDQLTQPGQWFLDRSATPWALTYLSNPGENPSTDSVVIPQIPQVLVASNLQYVTFQGLTFEHDNYTLPPAGSDPLVGDVSAAVSFQNSQNITFDAGIVAHTSGTGLDFVSCTDRASPSWCVTLNAGAVTSGNVVQNSAFYDLGATGVRIGIQGTEGDTDGNIPQFTTVENNVVQGYGRVFPGLEGILQGEGHNNVYTHNDVDDGYHGAITICLCSGAPPDSHDNTISFNHVYNLFQGIMNDGGSVRLQTRNLLGSSPPGNKVFNNKVHDVSDASALDANGYGGDGIYIDTQTGLVDVENNLVYRVSDNPMNFAAAPQNPNEANIVTNNIFAFGRLSLVNDSDPYPLGSVPASPLLTFVLTNNLFYFDRSSASAPLFYAQGGCTYSGGFAYTAWQQWNSNLYWRTDGGFGTDPQAFHVQPNPVSPSNLCFGPAVKLTFYTFAEWQKFGEDVQSVVQNPGFNNPAYPADDYSLPNGSPGVGFVVFNPNQAGRSNPVIIPPTVPATFPTKPFNPATDF